LIKALVIPSGGTALYSALSTSLSQLTGNGHTLNDWIIALTDGEDNASRETADNVMNQLRRSDVGLVMIGVGADLQTNLLERIAEATPNKRGLFVFADGSKSSIDMAFHRAAEVINSNPIIEQV